VTIDESPMGGGFTSTDELPLKLDLPLLAVPAAMKIEDLVPSRPAAPPTLAAEPVSALALEPESEVLLDGSDVVQPVVQPLLAPPVVPASAVDNAALAAAVEAELNRLAFVPDPADDVSPVEVPQIIPAEPGVIAPIDTATDHGVATGADPTAHAAPTAPAAPTAAPVVPTAAPMVTPVLQQGEQFMPKQSAAPIRHAYADLLNAAAPAAPPRRKKRRILRKLFSFLVMLGMVGGGLFAVKYYILDRVKWTPEIEPLAADVETTTGFSFDHDVKVLPLPSDDYALRLANDVVGITGDNQARTASVWRALGVASGVFDRRAIGLAAIAELPVFYDPADDAIYEVSGLQPELRTFALHRALTMALLDQKYDWSRRLADAAPSVLRGTRALYDAEALDVAGTLLAPEQRATVNAQLFGMYGQYSIPVSPAPFASAVAARSGLAVQPYLQSLSQTERSTLLGTPSITDGQLLDLRRLVTPGAPEGTAASEGMLFWYHALAARLDDDLAWRTALTWMGDDIVVDSQSGTACVDATFVVAAAAADATRATFEAWAGVAPAASATTVTQLQGTSGPSQLRIHACDPGEAVATNDGSFRLSLGGAPLRAEQYRLMRATQATLPPATVACAVYNGDAVSSGDERSLIDPVEGWSAPVTHPAPSRESC